MDSPIYEKKRPSDLAASINASGSGRKNGGLKENSSNWGMNPMYKNSQIKKHTRRNGSPAYCFPSKKNDSYLKRKIKHLQEAGGMNLSLHETLENSNLHYTRMAREKIAVQEAARKAMEARKLAMVEASWCRILKAARIKRPEAEIDLEKAKKMATEAFESAREMGVMMYDRPDQIRKIADPITHHHPCQTPIYHKIETNSSLMGSKSTHKITTSFETAFEVDRQVAAAVKKAFFQLAAKEEFTEIMWKISQNPDNNETCTGFSEVESEPGMVDTMLVRLKGLREDEMASLAEIVATCGLNAALSEVETARLNIDERYKFGLGFDESGTRKKEVDVPSLDKFLVKHVSKLEREVDAAKKEKESAVGENRSWLSGRKPVADSIPGLGSILVKHMSKLEREVYEAKRNSCTTMSNPLSEKNLNVHDNKELSQNTLVKMKTEAPGPQLGLGETLVKHKLKTERAKLSACSTEQKVEEQSKNQIEDRRKARERELMEAWGGLSLANSMRPRLSRIEREKVAWRVAEEQQQCATRAFQ